MLDSKNLRNEILQASFENQWAHLPSAFSHVDYISKFCETLDPENTRIVFGKPFGAQGYYIPFKHLGFIDSYQGFSEGVKVKELKEHSKYPEMFAFSDETIGNALGVAIGLALAERTKTIWCNISDACLQMGQTLEALLYILNNSSELGNLNVSIDYNRWQVHSKLNPDVSPIISMLYNSDNINAKFCSGHVFDEENDNQKLELQKSRKATFYVFNTVKGKGLEKFEKNPVYWHYQTINSENELKELQKDLT